MSNAEAPKIQEKKGEQVRILTMSVRRAVADTPKGVMEIGRHFIGREQPPSFNGINTFTTSDGTSLHFALGGGLHGEPIARLSFQQGTSGEKGSPTTVDLSRAAVGIVSEPNGDKKIYFVKPDIEGAKQITDGKPTRLTDAYSVYRLNIPQQGGKVGIEVIDRNEIDATDPRKGLIDDLVKHTTHDYLENPTVSPKWIDSDTYTGFDRRGIDTGNEIHYGTRVGDRDRHTGLGVVGSAQAGTDNPNEFDVFVLGHGHKGGGAEIVSIYTGNPETGFRVDRSQMEVLVEGASSQLITRDQGTPHILLTTKSEQVA